MGHCVMQAGTSRSFPDAHPLLSAAAAQGEVLLLIGSDAGSAFQRLDNPERYRLVLIELGEECLGVHIGEQTGEQPGAEGGNVLGFARFRLGHAAPSDLVEIVHQTATPPAVLESARGLFASFGLRTAACRDFPGRIVNRLIRPYYNAALARLDAGLATAADMDLTLRLGLGYPHGPIELLESTGLAAHCQVTEALYQALGDPAFAPARRAQVARARGEP